MKHYSIILLLLVMSKVIMAQEQKYELYRGHINDEIPITLYLRSTQGQCSGATLYSGMYRYDSQSKWLEVEITTNGKSEFVMVEDNFTGVLILKNGKDGLRGKWISPDMKRQMNVLLQKRDLEKKERQKLEAEYDDLIWQNHDC